jgi:FKBP-type peptidyl-prolyl cis-trans isomerase FklB
MNRMNTRLVLVLASASSLFVAGCQPAAQTEQEKKFNPTSDLASASYIIGYTQAKNIIDQSNSLVEMSAFMQGANDAVAGADPQVPMEQQEQYMAALSEALLAEKNASGDTFRIENSARPEVTTLASGLQYEVLVEGTGPKPSAEDTVVTHYHGTLTDGTVFDSSVERGSPASFPVNRVIPGWTEALQLMGVGSKWRLVIPPELAYGERGAGGAIPPNSTLVFEVELLEIAAQ